MLEEAIDRAKLYLLSWSKRQNVKLDFQIGQRWSTNLQGGRDISVELGDALSIESHLQPVTVTTQVTIAGKAFIVAQEMSDSTSFSYDTWMVEKALKYPARKGTLEYFGLEVVDNKRPLYGVYKAIEAISD